MISNKREENYVFGDMEDKGQILLYQTPDGVTKIEVKLQNETVWLSLDQMAELFQRNKSTISRHIKNVFEEGELQPDSTVAFFATVQTEGKRKVERDIAYYNLDMIISVGYRVHSYRGESHRACHPVTRLLLSLSKMYNMNCLCHDCKAPNTHHCYNAYEGNLTNNSVQRHRQ